MKTLNNVCDSPGGPCRFKKLNDSGQCIHTCTYRSEDARWTPGPVESKISYMPARVVEQNKKKSNVWDSEVYHILDSIAKEIVDLQTIEDQIAHGANRIDKYTYIGDVRNVDPKGLPWTGKGLYFYPI